MENQNRGPKKNRGLNMKNGKRMYEIQRRKNQH